MVYDAVDRISDGRRSERMGGMSSTSTYSDIKDWGLNPKVYAFSSGEVGRDKMCLRDTLTTVGVSRELGLSSFVALTVFLL